MNEITLQTRREAYDAVAPKIKPRSLLILDTMGDRAMTVSEITDELLAEGIIPYYDRNFVAPRMTEMRDFGIVEAVGRRQGTRSSRTEAVWKRTERK